ncbi:MAG: hypothetical protein K2Y71_06420 [Xanthobacteraceae bacterium]|nr:hypothetical protein [Xanthobacteraceae bacterium]
MIDLLRRWLGRLKRKVVCHTIRTPATGPPTRQSFPIWIDAPAYSPLSGGIRAMNLLCYHLNRLGFDAFIINSPAKSDARVPLRYLTPAIIREQKRQRREPIVIYPEITVGNPRGAKFVVRYLLNRPGFLMPGAELSYGKDDYFIDHAREHAPAGVRSFDLFMPLVDRLHYFPPPTTSPRGGFVVFTNRAVVDPASFPDWLTPCAVLSIKTPISHAELGELYRHSRAMVIFERSIAIFEALFCGCPVICIGNENFNEETYHPRFRDTGLIWGWHEQELAAATEKTSRFRSIYDDLENSFDDRVRSAFDWILGDVWRREHDTRRT